MPPTRSQPFPLGVSYREGVVNVAVVAAHAELVELCLLDPLPSGGWSERRIPLRQLTHDVWHDLVEDVHPGQRYGFRVHGPWDPSRGFRHNPTKLLADPYARAVAFADPTNPRGSAPRLRLAPELYGHTVDDDLVGDSTIADQRDSVNHAMHAVVLADPVNRDPGARPVRPQVPWSETIVYELHVQGFTAALPGVPEELRGTYAGLGTPAAIEHLVSLGVTTVELLPIHAIGDEAHLVLGGRRNYWGYNTAAFFAPHPGYAATDDPAAVPGEFQAMVDAFHRAGLEVVLDVVYNHTCEASADGPMVSFKGLDCATYYRLTPRGDFLDTTGCGNSLDFSSPRVIQLTLDSLRYWVDEIGVDGFRFDLATTLARGSNGGFQQDHPFLVALQTDPVLTQTKLIMEPWDLGDGGWRTGQYPAPLVEWNDHYRDDLREFWLLGAARLNLGLEPGGVRNLATRLAGSADVFSPLRGPLASINFITAHDGFTLRDLVSYDVKHNEANGEDNRDGSEGNRSYNHGVEGPTEDPAIIDARQRAIRNLIATLLLSTGVPMLVAGDELGRTQGGNNNAYSTRDDATWAVDWNLASWQHDLLATTTYLIGLRRENPALGQSTFFAGRPHHGDGSKDLAWFDENGIELGHNAWFDPTQRILQVFLHAVRRDPERGFIDPSFLIVIQATDQPRPVRLAMIEAGAKCDLVWDSRWAAPPTDNDPRVVRRTPGDLVEIDAATIQVYRVPTHSL